MNKRVDLKVNKTELESVCKTRKYYNLGCAGCIYVKYCERVGNVANNDNRRKDGHKIHR